MTSDPPRSDRRIKSDALRNILETLRVIYFWDWLLLRWLGREVKSLTAVAFVFWGLFMFGLVVGLASMDDPFGPRTAVILAAISVAFVLSVWAGSRWWKRVEERNSRTFKTGSIAWLVVAVVLFVIVYYQLELNLPDWLFWVLVVGGIGSVAMGILHVAAWERAGEIERYLE